MYNDSKGEITRLLEQIRGGEEAAKGELFIKVRDELRRMAAGPAFQKHPGQTLQPTDLLSEAMLRLIPGEILGRAPNRRYFFGMVAKAMRNVVVDHARTRTALKRGGGYERVPLDEVMDSIQQCQGIDVMALDDALNRLQSLHPRTGEIVEMKYFGGMTDQEVADNLGVSVSTVQADHRFARAWLREQLQGCDP